MKYLLKIQLIIAIPTLFISKSNQIVILNYLIIKSNCFIIKLLTILFINRFITYCLICLAFEFGKLNLILNRRCEIKEIKIQLIQLVKNINHSQIVLTVNDKGKYLC